MPKWKSQTREPKTAFERHQLKVAQDSMTKTCNGVLILGGPNHFEAAEIIHRITGKFVQIDAGCTCRDWRTT